MTAQEGGNTKTTTEMNTHTRTVFAEQKPASEKKSTSKLHCMQTGHIYSYARDCDGARRQKKQNKLNENGKKKFEKIKCM